MAHLGVSKRKRNVTKSRSVSSGAGKGNISTFSQPVESQPVKPSNAKKPTASKISDKKTLPVMKEKSEVKKLPVKSKATEKSVSTKKVVKKTTQDIKQKVEKK